MAGTGNRVKWIFELFDRVTSPARRMIATLDHFLDVGSRVVNMLERIGSIGFGGVKFALQTLAFKESTLESLRLMLGTEAAAERIFRQAVDFGAKTPFATRTVIDSFKDLLASGFTQEEVPIVFQALGDISAASDFSEASINGITRQLAQMKAVGKAMLLDIRPIISWSAQAGVGFKQVNAELSKLLGVSAQAIPEMVTAGQVSADAWIYAYVKAIKERTIAKELGAVMKAQSRTLRGLWSTIASIPEDFFLKMKARVPDMLGVGALKGAMENLITLFGDASPEAERLGKLLERVLGALLETIFGPLNGPEGLQGMRDKVNEIMTRLEKVDWREIFGQAKMFIENTTEAVVALAKAIGWVVRGLNEIRRPGSTYDELSKPTVRSLTQAERNEILRANLGEEPIRDQGFEAVGMKAYLHSSLPQETGRSLDEVLGDALDVPKFADGGVVGGPTLALIGEAGPEAVVPLKRLGSGSGGRGLHVEHLELHVEMPNITKGDEAHSFLDQLAAALEDLATEAGS